MQSPTKQFGFQTSWSFDNIREMTGPIYSTCSVCWKQKAQPQPLQTLPLQTPDFPFEANQLIKKKPNVSYSFIKLKFHSAHLVWLLCAQVAGIDSRSHNLNPYSYPEPITQSPTSPTHCRFPIPFPIPDPIAIVGFSRSVGLFICLFLACPLSPVLSLSLFLSCCPLPIVSLFWLPYNCFISPPAVYISARVSASVSASISASVSASASSMATTSHPWIKSKLCCHCHCHWNS